MGIWCNTLVPSGHIVAWTVDSTMYFDDIKAINTAEKPNDNQNFGSDNRNTNKIALRGLKRRYLY